MPMADEKQVVLRLAIVDELSPLLADADRLRQSFCRRRLIGNHLARLRIDEERRAAKRNAPHATGVARTHLMELVKSAQKSGYRDGCQHADSDVRRSKTFDVLRSSSGDERTGDGCPHR